MFFSNETLQLVESAEKELSVQFAAADNIAMKNQMKILDAMQKHRLSETHFGGTTGYGYNDGGRETLENIFASIFKAEAALVRPQLISGTHALTAAMLGNLRPGDELFSPTGRPYETLAKVIGIKPTPGSFAEYGIVYKEAALAADGSLDYDAIEKGITKKTKMAAIQRSKGYCWRPSFCINEIKNLIKFIKKIKSDVICLVDNCYGEFAEEEEPVEAGADIAVGSLIKNPGGGLAPAGGYITGGEKYVAAAADRVTAPGLGRDAGPTLGLTRLLLQGLFLAPQVVRGCVAGSALMSLVFSNLGYSVLPLPFEPRTDIVQAIRLGSAEKIKKFCRAIQQASPVDSFVTPEPAATPGYSGPVIMAGGSFIQGASAELSADAPIEPPYNVFFQGGLTGFHARIGVLNAAETFLRDTFV